MTIRWPAAAERVAALLADGRVDEAGDVAQAAAAEAERTGAAAVDVAACLLLTVRCHEAVGDHRAARASARRALSLVEDGDTVTAARALTALADIDQADGRYAEALALHRRVVVLLAHGAPEDGGEAAAARERLADLLAQLGLDAEAAAVGAEATRPPAR